MVARHRTRQEESSSWSSSANVAVSSRVSSGNNGSRAVRARCGRVYGSTSSGTKCSPSNALSGRWAKRETDPASSQNEIQLLLSARHPTCPTSTRRISEGTLEENVVDLVQWSATTAMGPCCPKRDQQTLEPWRQDRTWNMCVLSPWGHSPWVTQWPCW